MRWFFFGSLLDCDVLELVLDRPADTLDRQPATLHGYTRVQVSHESFPALRAQPGAAVQGAVFAGLTEEDARRICFYEGTEFSLETCIVETADAGRVEALVFIFNDLRRLLEHGWELDDWQDQHKTAYLPLARAWMDGYGHEDFATLEARWRAEHDRLQRRRRLG